MNQDTGYLALDHRISSLEQFDQRNQKAHREFYNRLQAVEVSHAVAQERHDQILKRFDNIGGKLEELTSNPGKRWNGLVDKGLYAMVGIVVAYIFSHMGF